MENHEIENIIKDSAQGAKVETSAAMWEKLDRKLESSKSRKIRLNSPWLLSIAAGICLLAACQIFLFNDENYNPDLIAASDNNGLVMEDLQFSNPEFYSIKKIEKLNEAYRSSLKF